MSRLDIALLLACAGAFGIVVSMVWWQRTHPLPYPFPCYAKLACIGGILALGGALCFAIAALLGGD